MSKVSVGSVNKMLFILAPFMYFTTNATHLQAHMTCWVYIGNLAYYLAVQPIGDVAYKLSDLIKRVFKGATPRGWFVSKVLGATGGRHTRSGAVSNLPRLWGRLKGGSERK